MSVIRQLQNNKKDMQQTRIQTRPMPELKAGEALLRISRLALTTNNVTYAAFGETPHLRYWDFYPTGDSEWFHICLLYTSPSPRDGLLSRMPSSA